MIPKIVVALLLVLPTTLPYPSLQAIPDSAVQASRTMLCGTSDYVMSVTLKHEEHYYMLWITTHAWIMAPYAGPDKPKPGTLATVVWLGLWEERDGKSWFNRMQIVPVPQDKAKRIKQFCAWLFPVPA